MAITTNLARRRANQNRNGSSMVIVVLLVSAFAVLSMSLITANVSAGKEQRQLRESLASMYASEAGIGAAYFDLESGGDGILGDEDMPVTFGSDSYWVQVTDLGDDLVSLMATGRSNRTQSRVELIVRQASASFYRWGAFGDDFLEMDSNAFVDSYNSSDGSYSSQATNKVGGQSYANTDGDVGSNGNVSLCQNATVFGDATPGPGGSATVLGNAVVSGSTVPATTTTEMPTLEITVCPPAGDLMIGKNDSGTLAAGEYDLGQLCLESGSDLSIVGPATIVCIDMVLESNSEIHVDATNGPVEFFVHDNFTLNSNTLITSSTFTPADITISLESDNVIDPDEVVDLDEVDFDSNAQLYGTIYAPNAAVEINSNFEMFGSLIARSVHLDSNSRIHFDEALMEVDDGEGGNFTTICWRVRPVGVLPDDGGQGGN